MNSKRALSVVEFSSDILAGPDGREALAQLRVDAQALADVRTLDEWNAAHPDESPAVPVPLPASVGGWCVFMMGGEFTGASPDEARAKAAAWAREQAKGAPEETWRPLDDSPDGY